MDFLSCNKESIGPIRARIAARGCKHLISNSCRTDGRIVRFSFRAISEKVVATGKYGEEVGCSLSKSALGLNAKNPLNDSLSINVAAPKVSNASIQRSIESFTFCK